MGSIPTEGTKGQLRRFLSAVLPTCQRSTQPLLPVGNMEAKDVDGNNVTVEAMQGETNPLFSIRGNVPV